MIYALIILCIVLFWIGGQKWAHTLFRDLGCSICLAGIATMLFGFHWAFLAIILIAWVGFTIGDHEEWHWSLQAFVVGLCMAPYAYFTNALIPFWLMIVVVTGGTYLASRFLSNALGVDVWCRGILYATIPLWFLIR